MNVLIAIDGSGSVFQSQVRSVLVDVISKLCSDTELDFCFFDASNVQQFELNNFLDGSYSFCGGGSSTELIRSFADDYDKTIIITDGYMDEEDLVSTDNIEVIVYE